MGNNKRTPKIIMPDAEQLATALEVFENRLERLLNIPIENLANGASVTLELGFQVVPSIKVTVSGEHSQKSEIF